MKLLADVHVAPRTVEFLRALGHERRPQIIGIGYLAARPKPRRSQP